MKHLRAFVAGAQIDKADELVSSLIGLRKAAPRPAPSTRYADWSPQALKAEAIKLRPLTGKSVSACAREFGVPRETAKDWLDSVHRPTSCPPEDFVEWLACLVDARRLVRVA